ncbi:tetratricopeptide repeat-containing sulfotransferase family protein [Glacieibacterium megasporae]|uniref:tetratricopeptide repeat-containing sulfotransferase family protein n=1 Tax=Glacieibacterium megasporae TaxID=2835787 RepID=UPI001C1E88AB|nr:sulfotransferase [Polymorphobacter megasporae]UAJ08855.1 sulfotransferase [Polymorphobacter megasporae]
MLIDTAPAMALVLAEHAVKADPAANEPRFVLGAALRRTGNLNGALALLFPLAAKLVGLWGVHYELGMTLAGSGRVEEALVSLKHAAMLNPASLLVLHALGDISILVDCAQEGDDFQARAVIGFVADPRLISAVASWFDRSDPTPLASFGLHLTDIAAVRLVADIGLRSGADELVAAMLAKALHVTPGYLPARFCLAFALYRTAKSNDALAEVNAVLLAVPGIAEIRALRAAILMQQGNVAAAVKAYAASLGTDADVWHGYGHALRALGRQDEAVLAYRRALTLRPGYAEVYWSLANLKTWRFTADDRATMAALLTELDAADLVFLHFALGKANDDVREIAISFAHYTAGNAARRKTERYDRVAHEDFIARTIATFNADFFAEHTGSGAPARDPIFVVGMPRSGSTLVEQILASHPDVDGLSELPHLPEVARSLGRPYPDALIGLAPRDFAKAGRDYLERVRPRRAGSPSFVDKLPGNVLHVGLIHLALPNARIVDIRRDAVATCFSLFKQLFARGQAYAYDLADLGHYYRHYVALIDHFAAVLPGRILTLPYEALVDDTEAAIRQLLAHIGLPFDAACLHFYANDRAVRTASSEQVRQPIFRSGLDDWRRSEDRLGPLIEALGPLAR